MKKLIVIPFVLAILTESLLAQEEVLTQEVNSFAPRPKATSFDSTTLEFSRDHISTWSKAWRDPLIETEGLAASRGLPSQTQSPTVKKRRRWPYLLSGAAVFAVGVGFTARHSPCHRPLPQWVTCGPWTSNWVLGGGIAMMAGGGVLMAVGASR